MILHASHHQKTGTIHWMVPVFLKNDLNKAHNTNDYLITSCAKYTLLKIHRLTPYVVVNFYFSMFNLAKSHLMNGRNLTNVYDLQNW